jgi:hypothetical protein
VDGKGNRANRTNSPMRGHCKKYNDLIMAKFENLAESAEITFLQTVKFDITYLSFILLLHIYKPRVLANRQFKKTYSISNAIAIECEQLRNSQFSSYNFKNWE